MISPPKIIAPRHASVIRFPVSFFIFFSLFFFFNFTVLIIVGCRKGHSLSDLLRVVWGPNEFMQLGHRGPLYQPIKKWGIMALLVRALKG